MSVQRRRDIGATVVYPKYTDDAFILHPSCFDALRAAWMRGEAFFDAVDAYGDRYTLKLGEVTCVGLSTPEGIRACQEERRLDKADDMVHGDDS